MSAVGEAVRQRLAERGRSRPASVRAPATETCWPSTARTASSAPSTAPGTRRPGALRTSGASSGVGGERLVDRDRVGVEVEQPAAALHRGGEVAQVVRRSSQRDVVGRARRERRDPGPCGSAACGGTSRVAGPTPRRRAPRARRGTRAARPRRTARGGAGAGTARRAGECAAPFAVPPVALVRRWRPSAAQLGRRRREHLADRLVELADAREAGRERDLGERQRGRLDQQAGGLRALRAGERERPGAELGDELAVQVALAVAEPRGEPSHALAVDAAVADQPHRAADHVGAQVPLRRAGRRRRAGSACRRGSRRAARRPRSGRSACSRASACIAGQLGRQ